MLAPVPPLPRALDDARRALTTFGIPCFNWLSCVSVPRWATFVRANPPTPPPCGSFKKSGVHPTRLLPIPTRVATLSCSQQSNPAVHLCRCRPLVRSRTPPLSSASWLKGRLASSSLVSPARLVWGAGLVRAPGLGCVDQERQLALDGEWGLRHCRSG